MRKPNLTGYILISLILGIAVGWLFPSFGVTVKPLADIFLRMVKMILAPLVFSTLVVGIAGHSNLKSLGRTSVKTLVYFEIVTTIALVIGLVMANLFHVGSGMHIKATADSISEMSKFAANNTAVHHTFFDFLSNMIPTSIFDAMAKGDILQIVIFAVIFAIAAAAAGEKSKPILKLLTSTAEIMFKFTGVIMWFAPIGVFAAIAGTVGQNGIQVLYVFAKLIFATYFSLFLFAIPVFVTVCKMTKIPFFSLMNLLKEPALLAFSTAQRSLLCKKYGDNGKFWRSEKYSKLCNAYRIYL